MKISKSRKMKENGIKFNFRCSLAGTHSREKSEDVIFDTVLFLFCLKKTWQMFVNNLIWLDFIIKLEISTPHC